MKPKSGPAGAVGIMGLGYVGIATAVALAHRGIRVVGYDVDEGRMKRLMRGQSPIFEPGLAPLLAKHVKSKRITLVDSLQELVEQAEVIYLSVPTPSTGDGSIDLSFVSQASMDLGHAIAGVHKWRLVVVKSTVVPGTAQGFISPLIARSGGLEAGKDFSVASNPEFLAEGSMVEDSLNPSRVVIGVTDRRSERTLSAIYARFPTQVVVLPPSGAELVKYASNAMLATRVSFANEMSRLAMAAGVDVYDVMRAVGMDPRIGARFLSAGPGFGGSCFPKDLKALVAWAREHEIETPLLNATLETNERQALTVVDVLEEAAPALAGKVVALLGLSFKSDTSDTRESRAYPIAEDLLRRGCNLVLYDPAAMEGFRSGMRGPLGRELGKRVRFSPTLREALSASDFAIIQADWDEFRKAPARTWALTRGKLVVDARRTLDPSRLGKHGVRYAAVGLGGR